MQLIFLLACVMAYASLMNAGDRPVTAPDVKLAWSALACAALVALAWWTGQLKRLVRDRQLGPWAPWIRLAQRLHAYAFLLVMLLVFVAWDFAEIVHSSAWLRSIVLADDLVVAIPLAIPLLVAWYHFAAVEPGAGRVDERDARLRQVWLQARHLMLLPLVPIFLVAGTADLQRLFWPGGGEAWHGTLGLVVVSAIALLLPAWLRCCWPTRALPGGPARRAIEGMLSRAGVRVTQILHWETQGQVANAAISGLLPGLRYLFVTDELLERLDLEQLRAITAHEAAHCRHGHLSHLAVSLTIPLLALLSVNPLLTAVAGSESAVRDSAAAPLLTLAVLGLWSVWHGRWSRLLEHHADLAACRLVAEPDQAISADVVASYGQALRATGGDADGDWLHPAPTTRIAFLERLAREPAAERDFERRLRATTRWQWLLIGLLVATWVGCS